MFPSKSAKLHSHNHSTQKLASKKFKNRNYLPLWLPMHHSPPPPHVYLLIPITLLIISHHIQALGIIHPVEPRNRFPRLRARNLRHDNRTIRFTNEEWLLGLLLLLWYSACHMLCRCSYAAVLPLPNASQGGWRSCETRKWKKKNKRKRKRLIVVSLVQACSTARSSTEAPCHSERERRPFVNIDILYLCLYLPYIIISVDFASWKNWAFKRLSFHHESENAGEMINQLAPRWLNGYSRTETSKQWSDILYIAQLKLLSWLL